MDIKLELDEKQKGAFNIYENETKLGEMSISISGNELTAYHTLVIPQERGKGCAKELLNQMVAYARQHKLKVIAKCPYVHSKFEANPGLYRDIWLM